MPMCAKEIILTASVQTHHQRMEQCIHEVFPMLNAALKHYEGASSVYSSKDFLEFHT